MGNSKFRPSLFTIFFGSFVIFCVIDLIYERYRRSGLTLLQFLSPFNRNSKTVTIENSDEFSNKYVSILKRSALPTIEPTKTIKGALTIPNLKLTLFQYQNCPFCSKVRVFLDYYGLPYDIIEVNPVMRQQIKFSKKYRKVPILLVSEHENFQQSSSELDQNSKEETSVSAMYSYLLSKNPKSKHNNLSLKDLLSWYTSSQVISSQLEKNEQSFETNYPANERNDELINRYFLMIGDLDEKKYEEIDPILARDRYWRKWVDNHLVHILSPNIYRTMEESFNSFRYFSTVSDWERIFPSWQVSIIVNVGATVMYFVGKRLKKKHNLKDDVRQSLYDSCNYWLKSIGPNRKFMGGNFPSLADLTVYGVLKSIEGCEAFKDLCNQTKISSWYFAVKTMVAENQGSS
ncbi:prostaglandin E synthase 2-like protein, partial [Sarcoptes scabiei]